MLCTPKSFPSEQTLINTIIITQVADLFNNAKFKVRNDMFFFLEMNGVLLGKHGRFMVAKSDFELITSGSYILNTTFLTID